MKELSQDIKSGNFKRVYLLYGPENYLKSQYCEMIAQNANGKDSMNSEAFYGKESEVGKIYQAALTIPFLAEYRVLTVKNSGLFVPGRKNDSIHMADSLKTIPETTVLVFVEREADKRSQLFKAVAKEGRAVEFKPPKEGDIIKWIINVCGKSGGKIDAASASYLLHTVDGGMDLIYNEIQKLVDYAGAESITKDHINCVCVKSLDSRIFQMVDAIGEKKLDKALEIYSNLMLLKESPIMVLSMIARQMRIILQVKELSRLSNAEIAGESGIAPFLVSSARSQGSNFTREALISAIKECFRTDIAIKTGAVGGETGVQMLILRFCAGK